MEHFKREFALGLGTVGAALALVACGSPPADVDLGPGASDPDSGTAEADLGPTEVDTGMVETDAGPPPTGPCAEIAAQFQTLGSANPDLPDPEVGATCADDVVTVTSNQIPDFPYIETSPGNPREADLEFMFPAIPTDAPTTTEIPVIGPIGVAINGIPIYGPTEGAGGDVMALGSGFTECGGHNGPGGYHFHTFDVTGSDECRFSEEEARAGPVLYGYAFDGYPIYSGNFQYDSSYELTDASLFASDTWAAHTYMEGLGDLDECNGRFDEDGNYAYYTTETFPYVMGCYRGVVTDNGGGGGRP